MNMGQDLRPETDIQKLRAQEDARVVERAPEKEPETPGEWLRQNLFSSPLNSLLTIIVGGATLWFGFRLISWVFTTADWTIVKNNLRAYMLGRIPLAHAWRVWAMFYMVVALAGLSYGITGARPLRTARKMVLLAVLVTAALGAILYLVETVLVLLLVAAVPVLLAAGVFVGRRIGRRAQRHIMIAWILAFPVAMVILRGFGGVPPRLWGGFVLNVVLAVVGIFASFPIGILLALGRRSTLPAIRVFCVAFIEVIRGAPLITWLVFGWLVLPLVLPPQVASPPLVIRTMIMLTIFSAAYVAEIVRGGLQGIHQGQYEASTALALSYTKKMRLVILPQALRSTIPAMVGHFISLFKDTSLVIVLGLSDLLRTARRSAQALEFVGQGRQREALLFAALVFFLVAFSMSRWSQRLEARLGVGER